MTSTETDLAVQVYSIYIKAKPEAIWEAITQPEWTEQYLYGSRAVYDLRPGGSYRSYGLAGQDGDTAYVDGEVIEVDPPRRLVQTWRALWDPTVVAEGFTKLTWEIEETSTGATRLTVTHELTGAPSMAAMVAGRVPNAGGGWSESLSGLKTLLETGGSLWK